jgi:hypothetical protein
MWFFNIMQWSQRTLYWSLKKYIHAFNILRFILHIYIIEWHTLPCLCLGEILETSHIIELGVVHSKLVQQDQWPFEVDLIVFALQHNETFDMFKNLYTIPKV